MQTGNEAVLATAVRAQGVDGLLECVALPVSHGALPLVPLAPAVNEWIAKIKAG